MEKGNLPEEIRSLFNKTLPRNINLLEDAVAVNTQLAYAKRANERRKERAQRLKDSEEPILTPSLQELLQQLNSPDSTLEHQQNALLDIAASEEPAAYELLKEYRESASAEIADWVTLALNESRILLESSLLEESQVYVSTGLGGRGNKLRYSVAFQNTTTEPWSEYQMKLLENELHFQLEAEEGELETIAFDQSYCFAKILLPLTASLRQTMDKVLKECNTYGNFLDSTVVMTNVTELNATLLREQEEKRHRAENGEDVSPANPTQRDPGMQDLLKNIANLIAQQIRNFNPNIRIESDFEIETTAEEVKDEDDNTPPSSEASANDEENPNQP